MENYTRLVHATTTCQTSQLKLFNSYQTKNMTNHIRGGSRICQGKTGANNRELGAGVELPSSPSRVQGKDPSGGQETETSVHFHTKKSKVKNLKSKRDNLCPLWMFFLDNGSCTVHQTT